MFCTDKFIHNNKKNTVFILELDICQMFQNVNSTNTLPQRLYY